MSFVFFYIHFIGTPDQNACTTQTEAKKVCEWKTSTALWSTGQCVPIASGIRYRKIGGAEDTVINPTLGELHYIPTTRFHHSAATSNGGATPGVVNRNGINGGHLLTSEYEKESTATGTSDHKEGAVAVMVFETATPKFADGATNPWMHVTASFKTVGDTNLKNGRQVVSIQSERERASRNGSTVVDISITPLSFKLVPLLSPCSPLSKTPKQVFF